MKLKDVKVGQRVICTALGYQAESYDGTYGRYYRPGHLGTIKTAPERDTHGDTSVWVEWDEKYQDGVWLIEVKHIEPISIQ